MGWLDWLRRTPRPSREEILDRARAQAAAGQVEQALRTYARLRRRDRAPAVLVEMADLCLAQGNTATALGHAVEALAQAPGFAGALCIQGEVLLREGRKGDARRRFEEAARANDPASARARQRLEELKPRPQPRPVVAPPAAPAPQPTRAVVKDEAWARAQLVELNNAAIGLHARGRYDEALPLAHQAVALAQTHLDPGHPALATALNTLAVLHHARGEYAIAEPLLQQALEIQHTAWGESHPECGHSLNNLAELHHATGNFAAAEHLLLRALEIRRTALGEGHPDVATSLNNLGSLHLDTDRPAAAEPLLRQALAIYRAHPGEHAPSLAGALNNLARAHQAMGDYATAAPLLRQAVETYRRVCGERHPSFATALNNLAGLHRDQHDLAAAEPLFRQALALFRDLLGEDHPLTATCLDNLAAVYGDAGNHAAAEPLLRQVVAIRRRILGEDHPQFVASLVHLAGLYLDTGNYPAATPLFRQALEVRRRTLGTDHPEFAGTLVSLAGVYRAAGDYTAAEPLYRQALEIGRATLGESHPDVVDTVEGLALLLRDAGNYAAAEPLLRQVVDARRTAPGVNSPEYADGLYSLGVLCADLGNRAAADPLLRQALAIRRTVLGDNHPDYAESLSNLGLACCHADLHDEGEPLLRQALEIRCRTRGEQSPEFAIALNNLAHCHQGLGLYPSAEQLLRLAIDRYRDARGERDPYLGPLLNNLSQVLIDQGHHAAAEPWLRQAIEIRRAALGPNHPLLITSLTNLVRLCAATGREAEALEGGRQAMSLLDEVIGHVFPMSSDVQRLAYLRKVRSHLDVFLSLVVRCRDRFPAAVAPALDVILRRKAIVAEAQALQRGLLAGRSSEQDPALREFSQLCEQIARKTLAGPGREGIAAHQHLLCEWNERRERLEAELARHIPAADLHRRLQTADRRAVADALPAESALVEFLQVSIFDFEAVPRRVSDDRWELPRPWQPAHYLAFVLPADKPEVYLIDLGAAERIDASIEEFRSGVAQPPGARNLMRRADAPARASQEAGQQLRAAVFGPLLAALGDCRRLLLSPDGGLTRLPFAVLPDADGRLLMDDYHISYVNCGRDVLRFGAAPPGKPSAALVVADPDFDLAASAAAEPSTESRGRVARDLPRDRIHFGRLPGTRAEGATVAGLLGVAPWQDVGALEARLKRECHSPRILHLATHGFFLEDQHRDPNQERRGLGLSVDEGRLSGPLPENPLLRAGLALAGANTWLRGGPLPEEAEDGLLTAEDVSGLDLLATELVVLSACETGLGEVRTGEGVFGLQRAFMLAGAKTLVMSLWSVPDDATRELMEDFYTRILAGEGRADALRNAQLALRQKYPDPYFWGAFLCQGDPAPLRDSAHPRVSALATPACG